MPSLKPDRKEIEALRKKRKLFAIERGGDTFRDLYAECARAVSEGYTTESRSSALLKFLKSKPEVASIYPNNALLKLLQAGCADGGWSPEIEHDILHFIYALYLGNEESRKYGGVAIRANLSDSGPVVTTRTLPADPLPPDNLSFILPTLKLKTSHLREALLSDHVDSINRLPDLSDRFVGFTGKLQFGSRAKCFAEARRRGAVPCEPAWYMDYLFVSRDLEQQGHISSKIDSAIFFRRLYGKPLILDEHIWKLITNDG